MTTGRKIAIGIVLDCTLLFKSTQNAPNIKMFWVFLCHMISKDTGISNIQETQLFCVLWANVYN